MSRPFAAFLLLTALALPAQAATTPEDAAPAPAAQPKRTAHRPHQVWRGYGFLPGYRTPERIERDRARAYYRQFGPHYWYGYPGWYHGQWNRGGFGPCWTQTPIGNVWNCGR